MIDITAAYQDGVIMICQGEQTILRVDADTLDYNAHFRPDALPEDLVLAGNRVLLFSRLDCAQSEPLRLASARRQGLPDPELRRLADELRQARSQSEDCRDVVAVYIRDGKLHLYFGEDRSFYSPLIQVKRKVFAFRLGRSGLRFCLRGLVQNVFPFPLKRVFLSVGGLAEKDLSIPVFDHAVSRSAFLSRGAIQTVHFSLEELDRYDLDIGSSFHIMIQVDDDRGTVFPVNVYYKSRRIERRNRNYYYIPFHHTRSGDHFYQLRRSSTGIVVLNKRGVYPVEEERAFRFLDSNFVSMFVYAAARIAKLFQRKKVNIFYEKYCQTCEEGAYDLFLMASGSPDSENYYLMDASSPDYERIRDVKNVLRKFSLPYYWAVFRSDYFISTDTPTHVGLIRPNNRWVKKATYDSPFFMLQHGVTYLKAHEKNSPYVYGKQYAPAYIVAGSEKEKRAIMDMLQLPEERILITGLPIFSRLQYNHITPDSDDIVTIMLTWKPYEEQIQDYAGTTYFRFTLGLYDILSRYVSPEKILIVPHPVVADQLRQTDMRDRLYTGTVFSALEKTKLLITDYSSVCYNVFYQGGGVVFYQEDLAYYEKVNGALIPTDDEYIGHRAFDMEQFEALIRRTVVDGKIDLAQLRTEKHRENALAINQFTDGQNLRRIYSEIKKRGII